LAVLPLSVALLLPVEPFTFEKLPLLMGSPSLW
jgi:hypothetical protein